MLLVVKHFIVSFLLLVATIDTMEDIKRQESLGAVRGKKGSAGELNICLEESSELTECEQPNESLNELLATVDLKTMQLEIEEGFSRERPINRKLARIRRLNME